MMNEKTEQMISALGKNLQQIKSQEKRAKDLENLPLAQRNELLDDHQYSREKIKGLIEKAEEAIDLMMQLASQAEHPRMFEVLSTMLKQTSEMIAELAKLQKNTIELSDFLSPDGPRSGGNIGGDVTQNNNTIFVGSTTELQQLLRQEANREKQANVYES